MENKPSTFTITLGYGVIVALALIVFSLVIYLINLEIPVLVMLLSIAILLAGIVFAQINFRNKYLGGYIEYGKAFTVGFLTTLFLAVIYALYSYVFYKYIDPGAMEEAMAKAEQQFVDRGMSDAEIDQSMKIAEMFAKPGMSTIMAFLSNLFFGAVISLIAAIFTKKENMGSDQPQV
jgi:hypothetical protein